VGLEGAHRGHALGDQALDLGRVAGAAAVFAALDVEAHELLEGRADPHQRLGEVEQAQQGLVPGDQLGGGVEHRDGLVEEVEAGQQQVVAAQLFGGAGAGAGRMAGACHGRGRVPAGRAARRAASWRR
jgi:hypothetical protein